ncbi:MAG: PepSY domain-containing protein [Opitutaceae bacterium]|nr:PepSY domain-containing protein [Opitutaceae bacterium]
MSTHETTSHRGGSLYRAVWRWHFYAGILVAPLVILLGITGAIYLWKPQFEAWRYRDILHVSGAGERSSAEVQLAAARAAAPEDWRVVSFQPSFAADEPAQVTLRPGQDRRPFGPGLTIYVDPLTARVLGQIDDRDRFMTTVRDLHGSLLVGKPGEYVVELAASWALVLFLTGLYLAWPRPRFVVWGFVLPRLRATGRVFWRDIHAVPAVWLSGVTVFLLATGLLWSQASGKWYRTISAAFGQGTPVESNAGAHRSELTGWSPPLQSGLAEKIDSLVSTPPADHGGHADHADAATATEASHGERAAGSIALDRVVVLASQARVPTPYAIALPVGPRGVFSVISDRNQAFNRTYLHLDQYSGRVLADVRFRDFGLLAQFALWGIIAHEGQLFGLANQILGTVAALGVVLLAVSGLVLWWRRRPAGRLGAPASSSRVPHPVWIGAIGLAVLLPLLAASLACVATTDWLMGRIVDRTRGRTA